MDWLRRIVRRIIAQVAVWLLLLLLRLATDRTVLAVLALVERMLPETPPQAARTTPHPMMAGTEPPPDARVLIAELRRIFRNPQSSRLARRVILEARRTQLTAVVRGALKP